MLGLGIKMPRVRRGVSMKVIELASGVFGSVGECCKGCTGVVLRIGRT